LVIEPPNGRLIEKHYERGAVFHNGVKPCQESLSEFVIPSMVRGGKNTASVMTENRLTQRGGKVEHFPILPISLE
jgi:hypothetical protein